MAGVLDKYIAGSSTGQSAAASSGGVLGTVKIEGVLDKYIEKPSDPIYNQWKLEQQMQEQMRQQRAQKAAQEEEKGVFAQVPQAVEPKTKEELRADRKAALADAREERRQARGNAALETLTAASDTAQNGVSTNFEKALEGALPSFWKQWRESGESFQEEKTAAWEPENKKAAPERYDPFVQNAGQAKAEWYDPEVIAKGAQAKGNPLVDTSRPMTGSGGMAQASEAMGKKQAIAALTEDQKAYINYVYGKYDEKLAGKLSDVLLENVLTELRAGSAGQKVDNVFAAFGGPIAAAPMYAAEMLGQTAENIAKGVNLPVAEYTPGSRAMARVNAGTQDLVDDAETPVGQFLAQTGISVGQNVLNTVLFGKAAPAMMAIQAMGSGGYEAAQNGATGWQQLGKGAQSAITELITEKISFGKLEDILNGVTPKTAKGIIAKIGAQMATEAGEETAGEAISMLYDWIAMGDKGDLAQVMKQYREENGDDGAGGYLALQILQRLGEAAAGGAISGGILGGGATVMNAVQNRNAEKAAAQAADLTKEAAKDAGDDAAQVEPETVQGAVEGGVKGAEPFAGGAENGKRTADTENAAEKSREREKRELVAKFAEDKSLNAEEKVKRIDFYLNMDRLSHKVNMDVILDSGNIEPTMSEEEYRRLEAKDRMEILEELGRFNEYRNAGGSVEEYIKNGTQGDDTKVVKTAKPVVETQQSVGGNTQSVIADSSGEGTNLQQPAENTQNTAEKKPPVNWRPRSIDAEEGTADKVESQQKSAPEEPAEPENKRSAESRAQDAARELRTGSAGKEKILQTILRMDDVNMTPEMRRVVAQNVAKELVENTPNVSKSLWKSTKALREYLHKTKMHIDAKAVDAIKKMGLSVTKFNDRYGTRLTTKNEPGMRSLDGSLAKLARVSNGFISADADSAFEEIVHTLDAMEKWKAGELDAQGMESAIDGAAEVLLKYAEETMEQDELEALNKGKKPDLQSTASQVKSEGAETKGSGWEKFKNNRIAQAMQHKPEGAVARMDAADSVRKAEEEIAHAEELLKGMKENAEKGEIDDAESIAKGNKTLQDVPARFSAERVALMAEQMRLIKQWEEQGLVGQKKRLHSEQFEAAEKLLEGADDAIFEHDPEGAKKLISKRKGELFRMLSSTSERVMRQVFNKKTAQRAIEEYIRPAERNEAAKIMAISRLFDGARELKLNRYESTMVQLVGEGLVPAWSKAGTNPLWHNGQALVESLPEYARANPEIQKLAENLGEIDAKKITKAVTWYRKTYDDFHALVNDFRLAHGMPEIGNIEQYFPHFSQDMDGDMLNQTLKAFGIEQMSSLPASIAGMTQGFRPFSRWVGSFQKRTGPQTVFDAEQGFQMYANAVMDMLYHTDDIMRIRHLETMIRRRSKEAGETGKRPGTKERLEAMKQTMENPEQLKKLEEDMELGERNGSGKDISGEYSGFVQWLREYGNKLAGKGDTYRLAEPAAGRKAANVINKLLGNYGTAQIVGNLRSAIANTAVLPKMLALLGTQEGSALKPEIYIGQALGKMARGEMANLYGKSEFMTSKQGVEPLVKTKKDKAADVMMKFFNVVEDAMSKLAFTAGYVQAEDQLKDSKLNAKELEREAIQRANDFAANIMARRDKAGSALLGRSREPFLRMVGMFQTEISNEWQTLRQDLPREYEELEQQIGKKKAQATYAAALARYVVYSHVLGFAAEAVFGINPFNDVWAWIADFVRNIWEEPEEEDEKGKINFGAVTDLAGEVAGSVPYLSTGAALAGYTNDRLPLFNAKEFWKDLASIVTAERFSGRVEGVANVAGSVGQLMGIPGTGQGVKTVKGAVALLDQGKRSQKTGQLQDVWQWDGGKGVWDAARAVAFGPSAMKGMREYYDSGYKAELTTAQTRAYDAAVGAGVPKDKALEYVKWSKGVTAEKDEKGNTVPHSRNVKFLAMADSVEGLTAEQQAILYQGALPSDQAEEFEAMSQTVKNMGIDTETWMEFLRRYYQINGSGKKDKVKKLMTVLNIPPVWQKDLAKVVGYEL